MDFVQNEIVWDGNSTKTGLFEMEMKGKEEDLFFGGLLLHAAKAIIYQISKNWCWFHSFISFDLYVRDAHL